LEGRQRGSIKNIVDGLVNATGNGTKDISEIIKGFQSGKVQQYAIYFLVGVIGLAILFIYWWSPSSSPKGRTRQAYVLKLMIIKLKLKWKIKCLLKI